MGPTLPGRGRGDTLVTPERSRWRVGRSFLAMRVGLPRCGRGDTLVIDDLPAMSVVGPSLSNVRCMDDGGSGHAHLHAQAPRASAKASAATRFVADVLPNSPAAPTSLKRSKDPMPADATPARRPCGQDAHRLEGKANFAFCAMGASLFEGVQ